MNMLDDCIICKCFRCKILGCFMCKEDSVKVCRELSEGVGTLRQVCKAKNQKTRKREIIKAIKRVERLTGER